MDEDEGLLIERAKSNPQNFGPLYDKYAEDVYRFILSRTHNPDEAENLTADTFYKALKCVKNFRGEASFKSYLLRIAINTVYDWFKRKKYANLVPDYGEYELKNEESRKLLEEIEKLPLREREVIRMHYIEGKEPSEIEFILNISKSNFYRLLNGALYRLRNEMEKNEQQGNY